MPEINDQPKIVMPISDNMKVHYEHFNIRRKKMSFLARLMDDLRTAKFDASDFQFSAVLSQMFQTFLFSVFSLLVSAIFLIVGFNNKMSVMLGFVSLFCVLAIFSVMKRKKRRFNGREY